MRLSCSSSSNSRGLRQEGTPLLDPMRERPLHRLDICAAHVLATPLPKLTQEAFDSELNLCGAGRLIYFYSERG